MYNSIFFSLSLPFFSVPIWFQLFQLHLIASPDQIKRDTSFGMCVSLSLSLDLQIMNCVHSCQASLTHHTILLKSQRDDRVFHLVHRSKAWQQLKG